MKEKTLWLLGGIAIGGALVGLLSAASGPKAPAKVLPPPAPVPAPVPVRNYVVRPESVQQTDHDLIPEPVNDRAPVRNPYAGGSDDPANAYSRNKDIFMRLAREWPGLGQLARDLEAARILPALDINKRRPELRGTTFEETAQDKAALAAGVAIRFHPGLFEVVTSIDNYASGPGREGRIFVDREGRWLLWNGKSWDEFKLAPPALGIVDWDALFIPDTMDVHPVYRTAFTPQEEQAFIAEEQEKAATTKDYVQKPLPVKVMDPKSGEWTLATPPQEPLWTFLQAIPSGLGRGDSDRVLRTIMIRVPDGTLRPAPQGPTPTGQQLVRESFKVEL